MDISLIPGNGNTGMNMVTRVTRGCTFIVVICGAELEMPGRFTAVLRSILAGAE